MKLEALKNPKIFVTLIIWIVAAVLLFQTDHIIPALTQVSVIVILFSWFFLNRFIMDEVKASIEVILLSFIIIHFLDLRLIGHFEQEILAGEISGFIEALHQFLLALQILFFALVIIMNNQKKQRVIFIYVMLALLSHFIIYQEQAIVRSAF